MQKKVLVLTGGGTAGHVLPHFALVSKSFPQALSQAVENQEIDLLYIGSEKGIEKAIVQQENFNIRYQSISVGKLRRYFTFQNILDLFKVIYGFYQACCILFTLRNRAIVFAKGGYVSLPVIYAAKVLGIKSFLHESDFTLSLTTKLCLPLVERLFLAFEDTLPTIAQKYRFKCTVSGLPIRPELLLANPQEAQTYFQLSPELPTLLVFGGSLGAATLNQKIGVFLEKLANQWNIIHLVGKGKQIPIAGGKFYRQKEFLAPQEMALCYAIASIAICRAGASSLFELSSAQIPMIMVPLGLNASRGDQLINAEYFAKKGYGKVIPEELLEDQIEKEFFALLDAHKVPKKQVTNQHPAIRQIANELFNQLNKLP